MDTVNNSAIEYTDSTGVQNKKKLIKATLNDNQSISNLSIGYGHQHKYYPHKVRNNNNNCSSPFWRDFLKRVLLFFFNNASGISFQTLHPIASHEKEWLCCVSLENV